MIANVIDAPFLASPSNTNAQNRTALQSAIAAVDAAGGGAVIVPSGINYGYVIHNPSTHPDLSACTHEITVEDYGVGASYAGASAPIKDGMQYRMFMHTPQTNPPGQHDGNMVIRHSLWSPWEVQSNNHPRPASNAPQSEKDQFERRSTWGTAIDGVITWAWGQGGRSGAQYDDYELSPFTLSVIGVRDLGLTDQTAVLQIERTNLAANWQIGRMTVNYRHGSDPYNVWQSPDDTTVSTYWVNQNRVAQFLLRESSNPDYLVLAFGGGSKVAWDQVGDMYPCNDGANSLGKSNRRWTTIYLASSPVISSDERLKTDIRDISEAERQAASVILKSIKVYRRKGETRQSIGLIAQQVSAALLDAGLDPADYDMVSVGEDGMMALDYDQLSLFCLSRLAA